MFDFYSRMNEVQQLIFNTYHEEKESDELSVKIEEMHVKRNILDGWSDQ